MAEIKNPNIFMSAGVQLSSISVYTNKYNTYFIGESFDASSTTLLATYSNGATRLITTGFTYAPTGALAEGDNITFTYMEDGITATCVLLLSIITGATGFNTVLDQNSWLAIKAASERSVGANYWAVGDMHSIVLNGTMTDSSAITFDNYNTKVYIIGFDHNSDIEGTGITFSGFKQYDDNTQTWLDICLSSSRMNISGNAGGWSQSRMRNVVLGSTDTTNGNATPLTPLSPKANSFMSLLPLDVRTVLRPISKWTDNVGGGQGSIEDNVKLFIDYVTLLSNWEVFGTNNYANTYESAKQLRYAYYAAGNSRVKNGHLSLATSSWWLRSPNASGSYRFCDVSTSGGASYGDATGSYGVVPAFVV